MEKLMKVIYGRSIFLMFKGLIFSICLMLLVPAYGILGFHYQVSCQRALEDNNKFIEVFKKNLPASAWPEGAKKHFSFMEFNVLNLIDHGSGDKVELDYKYYAKPLAQLQGIARVFKKHRPMLAFCVEIGSVKILKDYDQDFLGNQYEEFLIEGNDRRGVNVGLLVRKDLPLDVEIRSHKNLIEESSGELVFSRDLPAYILREKGNSEPLLIIFGTHFKSQRSSSNDFHGLIKRSMQAEAASLLIVEYEKKFPGVPIILAGDFNNDVRSAPEFKSLNAIGLVDSFDVAVETVPIKRRGTHYYFSNKGPASVSQMDSIMLNKVATQKLRVESAEILAHIDPQGNDYPPPRSYEEREQRASDHLPIMSIFDLSFH